MDLSRYHDATADGARFTEAQASEFAKRVAGDFNPIHDEGSKRFCVPGDLLFCVLLERYGAYRETSVRFAGMLGAGSLLSLPDEVDGTVCISDARGREILTLFARGERIDDVEFVRALAHEYVRFSGQTFPDLLVPLMREAGVMINPERPLVIYKDMSLAIEQSASGPLEIHLEDSDCHVTGKKGAVRLSFLIRAGDGPVARGEKNMVLSGLRPYDESAMQAVVDEYNRRKGGFDAATR